MKSLVTAIVLMVIFFYNSSFSQTSEYTLKNLNNIFVQVNDNGLLSERIHQKLGTEIKLKLMSAGIKVVSLELSKAILEVYCDAIESSFAEHRIIVMLRIREDVTTPREDQQVSQALTYFDYSFFTSKDYDNSIFNQVMDKMIIEFIEKYLPDN